MGKSKYWVVIAPENLLALQPLLIAKAESSAKEQSVSQIPFFLNFGYNLHYQANWRKLGKILSLLK